jgi:hypothetical protein
MPILGTVNIAVDFAFAHRRCSNVSFVMKEIYNKSVPSVSYSTAMDLLAGKLAIHSRSTGKNAARAFDDALVHARDAAHATVFNKLAASCSYDKALQDAEDIAQSVALRLFDCRVRARIVSNLPRLKTANDRKCWFGKVIAYTTCSAMREAMRGPKCVSIDVRDETTRKWKVADYIDVMSASYLQPGDKIAMWESVKGMLEELRDKWQSTKTSLQVKDWSPECEIIGMADLGDRPKEDVLSKRTRERRQEEAGDIAEKWVKRMKRIDSNEGPSL